MLKYVQCWVINYTGFTSGLFNSELSALKHVVRMIEEYPDSDVWSNYKIQKLSGVVEVEL